VENINYLIVVRLRLRIRSTQCSIKRLTRLITENFIVANVLIFETTGAFIVAYAFVVYGGYSNEMTYPYIYILLTGGISFAALLWSGRYCSPTLNPAVTLAYIFKGEKKIIPLIGCLYLACEFLGTLAGGVLGFTMIQDYDVPAMTYLTAAVYSCDSTAAFFQSFLSSFVFIVIILIMTTPSVSFT
jgi:glycerol uptake facilitator-like aquaporin